MQYENYHIEASNSFLRFEFWSEGPKGRIRKRVEFRQFGNESTVFNLSFGDIDVNGDIDDNVVTGNHDSRKVLATVALTVYEFFTKYPDSLVYIKGSTMSRTRLYRMAINNNLAILAFDFYFFGDIGDTFEAYQPGKNYEAFLIKKKKL